MHRAWYFVPGLLIFMSLPAFAATVDSVKGKVLINRGEGFQQVTTGAQANAGDQLMAGPGGSAKLVYSDRCQVSVIPGRVVSVGKQPPCTAQSLLGEDDRAGFWNTPVPFAIGAAVGWGIFCAGTDCLDRNREGANTQGRGRLGGIGLPASP
jgi:hypothetical protein